ncbi:hypothetical protein [Erwinia billingiae]|uniref:hypothetical protein n=1 Tax=Erwinia billingiae TaxID=182337 RepID=UPI0019D04ABF|nr:hypothetical protein [Erwinia billingiae]
MLGLGWVYFREAIAVIGENSGNGKNENLRLPSSFCHFYCQKKDACTAQASLLLAFPDGQGRLGEPGFALIKDYLASSGSA